MERLYCTINEEQARIAHDMMSMSDYKVGSKTEEYRGYVDKAYDLAEKVAEARPRETDRVEALAKRYSKRMAEYMNRESNIGCRCPSVMISGAGNFPVKKKEKQVQAWEKNHQFYTETQKILDKIKGILRGKDIIKSSDEDAIERLEEKLDALKENQERMRAVNKAIRLKNTKMGGLNDDVAAKRKVEDSVMGVAIEAEMQGFIYGFKVFEILLNRELATA